MMSVQRTRTLSRLGCALLIVLMPAPVLADLAGWPANPAPLSAPQQHMLAENPAIEQLQATHPWLVRAILTQLTAAVPTGRDASPAPVPSAADAQLLRANPALGQLWRSNPNASLSLLRLIRTAAQTGASRANIYN